VRKSVRKYDSDLAAESNLLLHNFSNWKRCSSSSIQDFEDFYSDLNKYFNKAEDIKSSTLTSAYLHACKVSEPLNPD
jgi:hypothetical protein